MFNKSFTSATFKSTHMSNDQIEEIQFDYNKEQRLKIFSILSFVEGFDYANIKANMHCGLITGYTIKEAREKNEGLLWSEKRDPTDYSDEKIVTWTYLDSVASAEEIEELCKEITGKTHTAPSRNKAQDIAEAKALLKEIGVMFMEDQRPITLPPIKIARPVKESVEKMCWYVQYVLDHSSPTIEERKVVKSLLKRYTDRSITK